MGFSVSPGEANETDASIGPRTSFNWQATLPPAAVRAVRLNRPAQYDVETCFEGGLAESYRHKNFCRLFRSKTPPFQAVLFGRPPAPQSQAGSAYRLLGLYSAVLLPNFLLEPCDSPRADDASCISSRSADTTATRELLPPRILLMARLHFERACWSDAFRQTNLRVQVSSCDQSTQTLAEKQKRLRNTYSEKKAQHERAHASD